MDACIHAIEHDAMSSPSSSAVGSPLTKSNEIDCMDEYTPPPSMAQPEESVVLTNSKCPNASTSPVSPTGKKGDKSPMLQSEGQCTLDTVMGDQYSPTALTYSGGQPTIGEGVNEVTTGRRPSENDKTQHTVVNPLDQAESTTKPTEGGNLRPLAVVEAPC